MTHFLNAHLALRCEKEILMFPKFAPLRYMEARSRLNGGTGYGCHVQINQLLTAQKVEPRPFLEKLAEADWQILYLKRLDIVRQSISTILATHRRQWVAYSSDEIDIQPIVILPDELHQWLCRRIDHLQQEAEALCNIPHLPIIYEHDLRDAANHQATMDRVFDFLSLPRTNVVAETKRLSKDTPQDSIANYAELMDSIRNTEFAQYTDLC